ncbi:unnamed protein product [Mytilus edulis]|uniref:Uncharacterized protein n=1 Tax=Mytilus edulis TaxID=6550 RepID=A0A8S3SBL3_MYTED|nr:unnamed protein product [Mytilus edulis]
MIEEKAASLHRTMPKWFSRSMEEDCQKTMRRIETFNTMVDNINVMINIFGIWENLEMFDATEQVKEDVKRIHIPVVMQLDIPTSWDKTKVFEAIDGFRLNGTTDMNIRIKAISIEDITMYAEVAERVLCNVHKLRSEINKLMSTMLSEAEINTTEHAEFGVNMKIPDLSGPIIYAIVKKQSVILKLDEQILENTSDADIEVEITDADEYNLNLETNLRRYKKLAQTVTQNKPNKEDVQDQISVKTNLPVSVTLRHQFNIKKSENENLFITSCIKIGNTLVFTDYSNNRLIICNSDGTDIHHIPLSYTPYYITEIDSNTVAVSCDDRIILIINISTRSITSKINTSGDCYGISYNDNNLYVVIGKSIIHVMDLTGKVIRTIPVPTDRAINDITVDRDRLVCIDLTSIYCFSLDGKLMWKFKKDDIQDLVRVTTDNERNVYVANHNTDTVVVVSDDGKHHRELLTKSDGLDRLFGIYFVKKENILLVCNEVDGKPFLFDVKKK